VQAGCKRLNNSDALSYDSASHFIYLRGCVKNMKTRYRLTRRGSNGGQTDTFVFWVFIIFNRCQPIAAGATTFISEKVSINGGGNGSFRQSKAAGV